MSHVNSYHETLFFYSLGSSIPFSSGALLLEDVQKVYIDIDKQIITSGLIHIRSWTYLAVHENEHYYAPLLLKPKGYCVSKKQEASFQALTDLRHSEAS